MNRRQSQRASRHRRRAGEGTFLYVLSFAEAVRRRRRPPNKPDPQAPYPTPPRPRLFAEQRPLSLKPLALLAPAPTRARELEDA